MPKRTGSKEEYERRKRARADEKAEAQLSTDPNKINVIINYSDSILVQKMLVARAETRADLTELTQRRDALFDQVDRQIGLTSQTPIEFRCQQAQITMNTLFSEVVARKPSKDFLAVTEIAVYLICKLRSQEEIDHARGYLVTTADNYLDIACCETDEECVQKLNMVSDKFAREGGYRVTIPQ